MARPGLADRLRPYHPGGYLAPRSSGAFSVASIRDVFGPFAQGLGDRLASAFGVSEPLSVRLRRVHSAIDAPGFRVRQLARAGLGLLVGTVLAGLAVERGLPAALGVVVVVAAPLLVFLVVEQRVAEASRRWQENVVYELPVMNEQLAMLLNAGYSLGAALQRIAQRGTGCVAQDLAVVVNRIRQGVSENEALKEWADVVGVDAVERLVSVLALHTESAALGRLVSSEARQARRDLNRRTIEAIERRGQQVWIPVTVATLVPGVILLAVPFLSALHTFANA
jgi:pilus assembly protein TadC